MYAVNLANLESNRENPFKQHPYRADKPEVYINSDICGKISSLGEADFFVLLKDDCTNYRSVYFVRHKSAVFSKFLEFQSSIERQRENKMKVLRTDNGGDYVNQYFKSHLKKFGIIHETSALNTAGQNGRAERDIRTITECARTMPENSKLPINLWAEAVNTAVHILNRQTCKPEESETPYEKLTGKELNLDHL
ncbi:hypothetical protein JTB14_023413 [Gonioctena quinquepunctata]|nr:hypothetical protein JTB14_023413 [Gonioctena quinquepunctata]